MTRVSWVQRRIIIKWNNLLSRLSCGTEVERFRNIIQNFHGRINHPLMADLDNEEEPRRCWWHKTKKILITRVTPVSKIEELTFYPTSEVETFVHWNGVWNDYRDEKIYLKAERKRNTNRDTHLSRELSSVEFSRVELPLIRRPGISTKPMRTNFHRVADVI